MVPCSPAGPAAADAFSRRPAALNVIMTGRCRDDRQPLVDTRCSLLFAAGGRGGASMSYAADPRVDAYIDPLPHWQQAICREVRDLVHAADAEVTETIKRTTQPYFVLQGNICALLAARDHVNVFLYGGCRVTFPVIPSSGFR